MARITTTKKTACPGFNGSYRFTTYLIYRRALRLRTAYFYRFGVHRGVLSGFAVRVCYRHH